MAIHFVSEPANGSSLVRAGLKNLSTRTSPLSAAKVDFKALQLAEPHGVYDLRADEVAAGGGLSSARLTGFRYLVTGGGTPVAGAEVHLDASGAANLLANINYGPYVAATAHALIKAAKLAPVAAGSYEARILRFSAIYVMALWLKPDSGHADIIYPLAPVPAGLEAERVYSEEEFFHAIRPRAELRSAKKNAASVP